MQRSCMLFKIFIILFNVCCVTCTEQGLEDDLLDSYGCKDSRCGCISAYTYDEESNTCVINYKKFVKRVLRIYDKQDIEFQPDDVMEKSIYIEGEKIFKGILVSVLLFIVCASICVITACIYCCRINYTDHTLKRDVKSVAKKLNKNYNSKKMIPKNTPLPPVAESCNVVVEDAGVFVV